MLLPQRADEAVCRSLRVQGAYVPDVQETRHLVRHVFLEKPRQSKAGTVTRRKKMTPWTGEARELA